MWYLPHIYVVFIWYLCGIYLSHATFYLFYLQMPSQILRYLTILNTWK